MASNMDREMILADFQACTGIENIDEAITLLEQNNWDLVAVCISIPFSCLGEKSRALSEAVLGIQVEDSLEHLLLLEL